MKLARRPGLVPARRRGRRGAAVPQPRPRLGGQELGRQRALVLAPARPLRKPGMRVLEVGAAKCWGAQHLVPRGCAYIGVDILDDPVIGLGRGAFYADRVGRSTASRPTASTSRSATRRSTSRTASPRCTTRSTWAHGARDGARHEAAAASSARSTRARGPRRERRQRRPVGGAPLGINEHVHTLWAYLGASAGPASSSAASSRPDGWPPRPYGERLSRIPKVGLAVGTLVHSSAARYAGVSILCAQAQASRHARSMRATFIFQNPRRELIAAVSNGSEPDSTLLGANHCAARHRRKSARPVSLPPTGSCPVRPGPVECARVDSAVRARQNRCGVHPSCKRVSTCCARAGHAGRRRQLRPEPDPTPRDGAPSRASLARSLRTAARVVCLGEAQRAELSQLARPRRGEARDTGSSSRRGVLLSL